LGEDGGRGGREEEVGILGSLFDGDKMWVGNGYLDGWKK